jgi:hypothetical protein
VIDIGEALAKGSDWFQTLLLAHHDEMCLTLFCLTFILFALGEVYASKRRNRAFELPLDEVIAKAFHAALIPPGLVLIVASYNISLLPRTIEIRLYLLCAGLSVITVALIKILKKESKSDGQPLATNQREILPADE